VRDHTATTPVAQAAQASFGVDRIPMGRAGLSEEIANVVIFLASPL